MDRIAVITGAGSGVGQAVAVALAKEGWAVALVGRTESTLRQTAGLCPADAKNRVLICPGDVSCEADVSAIAERVRRELGDPIVLVNSAGTNVARRALGQVSPEDFRKLIDINLTGAFLMTSALLEGMRRRGGGTIVNVISDAGVRANATAGVGYVSSKFGLAGLTESINVEQRRHGIRATAIFPGEINTPLLDKRPAPPPQEARLQMLQPEDVAACVLLAINLPQRALIEQIIVRPRVALWP